MGGAETYIYEKVTFPLVRRLFESFIRPTKFNMSGKEKWEVVVDG
jgi:hypothetical protein